MLHHDLGQLGAMPSVALGFELWLLVISEIRIVMQMEAHNGQHLFAAEVRWQPLSNYIGLVDSAGLLWHPRGDEAWRQVRQVRPRSALAIRRSVQR
jgi:hypothetical protein